MPISIQTPDSCCPTRSDCKERNAAQACRLKLLTAATPLFHVCHECSTQLLQLAAHCLRLLQLGRCLLELQSQGLGVALSLGQLQRTANKNMGGMVEVQGSSRE